jgi:hypothetical protein
MKLFYIHEMAKLSGWGSTDKIGWSVYDNGDEVDVVQASNERDAVELIAAEYDLDPETLTAAPTEDKDEYYDGLRKRDIKSINSESTRKTIENWLNNNKTPYEWAFYFGDTPYPGETPGVITFVKYGNAGGDILTPHMILHTVGHAVMSSRNENTLIDLLVDFAAKYCNVNVRDDEDNETKLIIPICKFLHMKAAFSTLKGIERWSFPTINEVVYEMVGIYVKNGHVKFKANEYNNFNINPKIVNNIENKINDHIREKLDDCVGTVIYDD